MISLFDREMMARALMLAERGRYTAMPNPVVGCVITLNESIIGEGWHQRAGEAHAEINALAAIEGSASGATAYVSLEPCNHQGRTGPCSQALIDAGIARVVYAMEDPNPAVGGAGIERLENAGIAVSGPLMESSAELLNAGFIKRMVRKMPYVRVKSAMSVDGRTAMASGDSKWVTGPTARADVQKLRARSCAVITGIGSILFDDPNMTVRETELPLDGAADVAARQPLRVVVDSQWRTPLTARLFNSEGAVLIVGVEPNAEKQAALEAKGAQTLVLKGPDGRVHLRKLLQYLAQDKLCNEVLIEAGHQLSGSVVRQGLMDQMIVYMAPKLMGSKAMPLFDLQIDNMKSYLPLKISDIRQVGRDWRMVVEPDFDS